MTWAYDSVELTEAIVAVVTAGASSLEIANVYYGDEPLIPTFPSVTVEFSSLTREISETQRFTVQVDILLTIYHGMMQEPEVNTRQSQEIAEGVDNLLSVDRKLSTVLGGKDIIFNFVTGMTPGFVSRNRKVIRATRIVNRILTKEPF